MTIRFFQVVVLVTTCVAILNQNKNRSRILNNTLYHARKHIKYGNAFEFKMSYGAGDITGLAATDDSTTYPLFVWVTGTDMLHWTNDDQIYCNYMVERGFVSASIEYPNTLYPLTCGEGNTAWIGKARRLFDSSDSASALSVLCNPNSNVWTAKIDCNKGIILAGFSQGAQLVSLSGNFGFNDRIRGIYQMGGGYKLYRVIPITFDCLKYENTLIDQQRIRSCVGENDAYFGVDAIGVFDEQREITNYCTGGNDNDVIYNCLQSDGSGFYIVQNYEPLTGNAVHCYAYENDDCHANDKSPEFDFNYNPGSIESNQYWSMSANLNWLISKV